MRTTITAYTAKGTPLLRFSLDLLPAFDETEESKSGLRDLWELSRVLLARFTRAENVECCQLAGDSIRRLVAARIFPEDSCGDPSDDEDAEMIGARIIRENVLRFEEVKPSNFPTQ